MVELNIYEYEQECVPDTTSGRAFIDCAEGTKPQIKLSNITRLDLSKNTVIGLSKDIFDMMEVTKNSDTYTYNFKLPATPHNTKFFENFGNLNWVGEAKFNSFEAGIVSDGVSIFEGKFILVSYDANIGMYEGRLVGNMIGLTVALDGKVVSTLNYLNRFNHEYTGVNTITDSWRGMLKRGNTVSVPDCYDSDETSIPCTEDTIINHNKEIMYPLSDNTGLGYWHNDSEESKFWSPFSLDRHHSDVVLSPFDASILTPAIKLIPLIENILIEAGFTPDLSYYKGARWDNLYINTQQPEEDVIADVKPLAKVHLTQSWYYKTSDSFNKTLPIITDYGSRYTSGNVYYAATSGEYIINLTASGYNQYNWLGGNNETYIQLKHHKASDGSTELIKQHDLPDGNITGVVSSSFSVDLEAGDYIFLNVKYVNSMAKSFIYIEKSTGFEVISAPKFEITFDRSMGAYFGKLTQLDLLKEFLALTNAVITYDEDRSTIHITPLINKWLDNSVAQMDITDKIDRNGGFKVMPATQLMPSKIEFKWANGDDVLSTSYKAGHDGTSYGATKLVKTSIINAGKSFTHESKFKGYPTGALTSYTEANRHGIDTHTTDLILPLNYKDVNKFNSSKSSLSLFYWDSNKMRSLLTEDRYAIVNWNQGQEIEYQGEYPMCHNLLFTRSDYAYEPGIMDINWEASIPFSVNGDFAPTGVNNNLFDNYYLGYIASLYEDDAVIIDTSILLTPAEFSNLNLFAPLSIDNSQYRVISYSDYDVLGNTPMKVRLIKDNINITNSLSPLITAMWYQSSEEVVVSWTDVMIEPTTTKLKWNIDGGAWTTITVDGLNTYTITGISQTYQSQTLNIEVINSFGLSVTEPAVFSMVLTQMLILKPSLLDATYNNATDDITFTWLGSAGAQQYDLRWSINEYPGQGYILESNVSSPFTKTFPKTNYIQNIKWNITAINGQDEANEDGNDIIISTAIIPDNTPDAVYASFNQLSSIITFNWSEVDNSTSMRVYWEECGDNCIIDANYIDVPAYSTSGTASFTADYIGHNIKFYVKNTVNGAEYNSNSSSIWIEELNVSIPQMLTATFIEAQSLIRVEWSGLTDVHGYNCTMFKNGKFINPAVESREQPLATPTYDWINVTRSNQDDVYEFTATGVRWLVNDPTRWYPGDTADPMIAVTVPKADLGVPAVLPTLSPYNDIPPKMYIQFYPVPNATGYDIKYSFNGGAFIVSDNHPTSPYGDDMLKCLQEYNQTVAEQTMTMAVRARFGNEAGAWSTEITSDVYTSYPAKATNVRFGELDEFTHTISILFDYPDMSGIDHFIVKKMQYDQEYLYTDVNVGLNHELVLTNVYRLDEDYKIYASIEAYSTTNLDSHTNTINITIDKNVPITTPSPVGLTSSYICDGDNRIKMTYNWNEPSGGADSYLFTGGDYTDYSTTSTSLNLWRTDKPSGITYWSVKAVKNGIVSTATHSSISVPDTMVCH